MAYNPDGATYSVISTVVLNAAVAAILYAVFEYCRGQKEVFFPRTRTKPGRAPGAPSLDFFGWIESVNSVDEHETLRMIGMDAYIFLRFLRMFAIVCLVCGFFGVFMLWPVYFTAGPHQDGIAGINLYTMANISPGGDRLWASVFALWLFNIIFLYIINNEYDYIQKLRTEFLLDGDVDIPAQTNYSVLIEDIPSTIKNTDELKEAFNTLFPNEVHSTHILFNIPKLDEVVTKRAEIVNNLELAICFNKTNEKNERKMVSLKEGAPVMCCGEVEVDAEEFFTKELELLNHQIESMQKNIHADSSNTSTKSDTKDLVVHQDEESGVALSNIKDGKVKSTKEIVHDEISLSTNGIITFTSKSAQTVACQLQILFEKFDIYVHPAPAPSNIVWSNMTASRAVGLHGETITLIIFSLGLLFWGPILAFIQAISQLQMLAKFLPFVNALDPTSYSLIAGILPVAVMNIFISLIPTFLAIGADKLERRKTFSAIQQMVFEWFFYYQLANVYLTLLSGSIFNSLSAAISDPTSILVLLANALPTVSVFFSNFVISAIFIGNAVNILQIGPLIVYNLYLKIFTEKKLTRRQLLEGPLANIPVDYGTTLPSVLFIVCIVLTYWVIAPFLLVLGAAYFISTYYVMKYKYLYIHVPVFETGGKFWFGLYKYTMLGLFVSSITMVVYIAIKQGAAQAPIALPIPFIIYYYWGKIKNTFEKRSLEAPFSRARANDTSNNDNGSNALTKSFEEKFYCQPSLLADSHMQPQEYRINDVPLVNDKKEVSDEYFHVEVSSVIESHEV